LQHRRRTQLGNTRFYADGGWGLRERAQEIANIEKFWAWKKWEKKGQEGSRSLFWGGWGGGDPPPMLGGRKRHAGIGNRNLAHPKGELVGGHGSFDRKKRGDKRRGP